MSGQSLANLERLFDRFYRIFRAPYQTRKARAGIITALSIIHAHGGELSAEQQGREIVFKVRSVNGLTCCSGRNLEGDKIVIQSRDNRRLYNYRQSGAA